MRSRSLLSYYSWKPYRVCPDCNARYTADRETRRQQVGILVLALVALGLVVAVILRGFVWLVPAVLSHVMLWVYIGYVLSKVTYIPYRD